VYTLASDAPAGAGPPQPNRIKNLSRRVDALATTGKYDDRPGSRADFGDDDRTRRSRPSSHCAPVKGATTLVADPRGRALVADTRGGQLLVYGCCFGGGTPLILRQAYPVPQAPYGLAASTGFGLGISNRLEYGLLVTICQTGIPVEKVRYPTVQQTQLAGF